MSNNLKRHCHGFTPQLVRVGLKSAICIRRTKTAKPSTGVLFYQYCCSIRHNQKTYHNQYLDVSTSGEGESALKSQTAFRQFMVFPMFILHIRISRISFFLNCTFLTFFRWVNPNCRNIETVLGFWQRRTSTQKLYKLRQSSNIERGDHKVNYRYASTNFIF